jgi:hypothetical protein
MASEIYVAVTMEDSCFTVVKTDPANPRIMEVVATFYDAKRAREYADISNEEKSTPRVEAAAVEAPKAEKPRPVSEKADAKPNEELSDRQAAVLTALRAKMSENKLVETKAAVLAEAAQIPLGSLHSVLGSLEKKQLIVTTRPGSPRAPAVYQVL